MPFIPPKASLPSDRTAESHILKTLLCRPSDLVYCLISLVFGLNRMRPLPPIHRFPSASSLRDSNSSFGKGYSAELKRFQLSLSPLGSDCREYSPPPRVATHISPLLSCNITDTKSLSVLSMLCTSPLLSHRNLVTPSFDPAHTTKPALSLLIIRSVE